MLRLPGVQIGQAINRSHPLARDLRHWWIGLPGRSGGSRLYDIAGARNATLANGAEWRGGSIALDGSDDHIALGTLDLSAYSALWLSAWIYRPTAWSGVYMLFEITDDGAQNVGGFAVYSVDTAIRYFIRGDVGQNARDTDGTSPPVGEWFCLDVIVNFGGGDPEGTIYFNGVAQPYGGFSVTGDNTSSARFAASSAWLGIRNGSSLAFGGSVGSVMLRGNQSGFSSSLVAPNYLEARRGFPTLLNRRRLSLDVPQSSGGGSVLPIFRHHYVSQGIA